jgi:hypothetical protein
LVEVSASSSDLPGTVEVTADVVTVPSSDIGSALGPGPSPDPDPNPNPDPPESTETDPVEDEFQDKAPILESWLNAPQKFPETTVYLKRGLADAIERLTDGYGLYEGTGLEYRLSSQKRPFIFSITEDLEDNDQIVIDPDEFRLSDLRSVLRFGIERDKTPRSASYEDLLKDCGSQLTGYAIEWRKKVCEANLEGNHHLYKKHAEYDFADFVLAAYSYVVLLDSPWEHLTADAVAERFDEGKYAINNDVESWLQSELEHSNYEAVTKLVEAGPSLDMMMGKLFGVSGSDLDRMKIKRWFKRKSPRAVLAGLGRGQISNVAARIRFDDGPKLRDIADTAYDTHSGLDGIEKRYQHDIVKDVETNLNGLSMDDVSYVVSNLDTYDVNPNVMEPLKRFSRLDQSKLDEATTAATLANRLNNGRSMERIQAVLASVKLANSTVYERYSDVQLTVGDGSSEIGATFMEVAEHYVE